MPNWSKCKDCLYVLLITYFGSRAVDMFIQPLTKLQWAGIMLISVAAIGEILRRELSDTDQIQQIFQAKKVEVDGKFPRLVKGE